jgi:hypothetical protein
VVTEALNEGTDTVQSSVSYGLGANIENLTLTGNGNIDGGGNGDANAITGNSGNNILNGGGGNDTLVGGGGTDTAAYNASITTASVTSDGAGHFLVAAGGSEGTDTLSGIEKIDGAGTPTSCWSATAATPLSGRDRGATTGDTIMIAAGTYSERGDRHRRPWSASARSPFTAFESDNGVTGIGRIDLTAPSHKRRGWQRQHRGQQCRAVEHQYRRLHMVRLATMSATPR